MQQVQKNDTLNRSMKKKRGFILVLLIGHQSLWGLNLGLIKTGYLYQKLDESALKAPIKHAQAIHTLQWMHIKKKCKLAHYRVDGMTVTLG